MKDSVLRSSDLQSAEVVRDNFTQAQSANEARLWVHGVENYDKVVGRTFKPIPKIVSTQKVNALQYSDGSRSAFYILKYNGVGRELHLFAKPDDDFKVDWQSFYYSGGKTQFYDYLETLPKEDTRLLCYLTQTKYYTRDFPETDYSSYKLRNYTGDKSLYCFVLKGSDLNLDLYDKFRGTTLLFDGENEVIRIDCNITLVSSSPIPIAEFTKVSAFDWISHLDNTEE